MTLKERAKAIAAGVVGLRGIKEWDEGDEEFIRQELEKLLGEAAGGICPLCGRGTPRTTALVPVRAWFHDTAVGEIYCLATPIWKMVEGG